jgi:nitroimidazol reductase NimA-like FMN-containing flavoprotein (pyridoxamine 5'-phosphate oxidase superfamily)
MSIPSLSTKRTRVLRQPERGRYDRETVNRILDEGFICHVGFLIDGQPFVIPTSYGRDGDLLYIHGSPASRMLRNATGGMPICVAVTLVDGLVLARSVFNHSMNYRSVVIVGAAVRVEDREEKLRALRLFSEHIIPGRWEEARRPSDKELKATTVVRLPINEFSAKVRTGPPVDDREDYEFPVWAGVVPLRIVPGEPVADARLREGVGVPEYVRGYQRPKPPS